MGSCPVTSVADPCSLNLDPDPGFLVIPDSGSAKLLSNNNTSILTKCLHSPSLRTFMLQENIQHIKEWASFLFCGSFVFPRIRIHNANTQIRIQSEFGSETMPATLVQVTQVMWKIFRAMHFTTFGVITEVEVHFVVNLYVLPWPVLSFCSPIRICWSE